jgi:dihydrofolate synthase/folylpolyglutamate synthase
LSETVIREGLGKVTWPGRFEILLRNPLFIVDGGHNPQCSEALIRNLLDYLPERRVIMLTGVLADKDYDAMYALVDPVVERYITVTPNSPRALTSEDLAKHLRQYGKPVTVSDTPAEGVSEAVREAGEDGIVCAFGSLYIVGDIRKCFGKE